MIRPSSHQTLCSAWLAGVYPSVPHVRHVQCAPLPLPLLALRTPAVVCTAAAGAAAGPGSKRAKLVNVRRPAPKKRDKASLDAPLRVELGGPSDPGFEARLTNAVNSTYGPRCAAGGRPSWTAGYCVRASLKTCVRASLVGMVARGCAYTHVRETCMCARARVHARSQHTHTHTHTHTHAHTRTRTGRWASWWRTMAAT